jgi:transketolase
LKPRAGRRHRRLRREERKHRHPQASQNAIQALAPVLPEFLGGSADLTGSNLTNWKECVALRSGKPGNHINYGVREFGMSAIMNGITCTAASSRSAPPS